MNWGVHTSQGAVKKVLVNELAIINKNIEKCFANSVKYWRFPAPRGGGIVAVEFPFSFEFVSINEFYD